MSRSSRAIIFVSIAKLSDRCFCYFTAAMFVSLKMTQTWRLHTKLHKFGWHSSANNARMKNGRNLILGELVYISIICRISDSWLFSLYGYDFYFDHMTGESRESVSATSPKCIGPLQDPVTWYGINLYWDVNNAVGLSKKWQVGMDWKDFFFWKSHCVTCVPA